MNLQGRRLGVQKEQTASGPCFLITFSPTISLILAKDSETWGKTFQKAIRHQMQQSRRLPTKAIPGVAWLTFSTNATIMSMGSTPPQTVLSSSLCHKKRLRRSQPWTVGKPSKCAEAWLAVLHKPLRVSNLRPPLRKCCNDLQADTRIHPKT